MSHYHEECRYCGAEWDKGEEHAKDCPLNIQSKQQAKQPPKRPITNGYPYCF